jgi:hypothetical protein
MREIRRCVVAGINPYQDIDVRNARHSDIETRMFYNKLQKQGFDVEAYLAQKGANNDDYAQV